VEAVHSTTTVRMVIQNSNLVVNDFNLSSRKHASRMRPNYIATQDIAQGNTVCMYVHVPQKRSLPGRRYLRSDPYTRQATTPSSRDPLSDHFTTLSLILGPAA
jgi:hypothetical protein